MQPLHITHNNRNQDPDALELACLNEALSHSEIGTWSFDFYSNSLKVSSVTTRLTEGAINNRTTARGVMKRLTCSFLRKIYYAFYASYVNQHPIAVEILLSKEKGFEDDRWICLKGRYNPDFCKFSGILYDITESKNKEDSISVLVAKLSHELRSPLTAIKLCAQQSLEMSRSVNEDVVPFLSIANSQVNRMNLLIDDFILSAMAGSNSLTLRKSLFPIKTFLEELIAESFPGCGNDRIVFDIDDGHQMYADKDKMVQVVNNYISNALKYSPEGAQVIVRSGIKKGVLTLSVQDFGIGIDTDEQQKLFQKYYRCKNVLPVKGYGIGLFIVREILEAHQGTFGLSSTVGKGSTFYFTLPVPAAEMVDEN